FRLSRKGWLCQGNRSYRLAWLVVWKGDEAAIVTSLPGVVVLAGWRLVSELFCLSSAHLRHLVGAQVPLPAAIDFASGVQNLPQPSYPGTQSGVVVGIQVQRVIRPFVGVSGGVLLGGRLEVAGREELAGDPVALLVGLGHSDRHEVPRRIT